MKVFDLATSQLRDTDDPAFVFDEYSGFFGEYFRAFDDADQFRGMLERAVERARTRHETSQHIEKVVEASRRAERRLEPLFEAVGLDVTETELFVFIGRGMWDGHGMVGGDRPRWFLDMTLVSEHLADDDFAVDVHLVHEMIHAVHYQISPDFFPAFDKSDRRRIFDQFIAEGLATSVSSRLTECDERQALWFGSLDAEEFGTWRSHAKEIRPKIGDELRQLDDLAVEDADELNEKLFRIPGELVRGRIGYLYGRDIVADRLEESEVEDLMKRRPGAWNADIRCYFGP